MGGKLFGVGVGTGDPELITLKALRVLRSVDVICAPKTRAEASSRALNTIKPLIQSISRPIEIIELIYPMIRDLGVLEACWRENAEAIISRLRGGKDVAFITLGDPMLYSTFIYTLRKVKEMLPDVGVEVIPGVTSFTACACASMVPIAENDEVVALIPSTAKAEKITWMAKYADTLVFMKGVKNLEALAKTLMECGFSKESIVIMVKGHGTLQEEVIVGNLMEIFGWKTGDTYFSTFIIKRV